MAVSKPGPKPQYPQRFIVQLRADQRQALGRISKTTGISVSRLIRWFIDEGVYAFESNPTFKTLPQEGPAWASTATFSEAPPRH